MRRNTLSFDYAIKGQLRNKANYDIVSGFISELFKRDVKIVEILESEKNKKRKGDKANRVDIVAKESDGSKVIIELQFNHEIDFFQRMLYETSATVSESLSESEPYKNVCKVYSVNIMYFDLGMGKDYIYHGTTTFRGLHSKDVLKLSEKQQVEFIGKKLPDELYPEYYILNLKKFDDRIKDTLDEWMEYLKTDKISPKSKAKGLAKAKKVLDYYKLSPEKQKEYDHRIDQRRSMDSAFYTAKLEGRYEGIAEGRAEGIAEGRVEGRAEGARENSINTARKMKKENLPIELIVKITGLAKNEIAGL